MASKTIQFRATEADQKLIAQLRKKLRNQPVATVIRRALEALAVSLGMLFLFGCGGVTKMPIGDPTPHATPVPIITSAQVFSNTPQTWKFADRFNPPHLLTIDVSPIACAFGSCGDITVLHFKKGDPQKSLVFNCAGYWANHTPEQCAVAVALDELYFVLRHDADGAWRCIGFTYLDYLGIKRKVQINAVPGQAPPYTIIPAASNVSEPNTSYNAIIQTLAFDADLTDFSSPTGGTAFSTTWRTDASVQNGQLSSLQHEGCVLEDWLSDADALETIDPIVGLGNNGVCLTLDPRFTMVRTH